MKLDWWFISSRSAIISWNNSLSKCLLIFLLKAWRLLITASLLFSITLLIVVIIIILLLTKSIILISLIVWLLFLSIAIVLFLLVSTSENISWWLELIILIFGFLLISSLASLIHIMLFKSWLLILLLSFIETISDAKIAFTSRRVMYFNRSSIISHLLLRRKIIILINLSSWVMLVINYFSWGSCKANILWRHLTIEAIIRILLIRWLVSLNFILVRLLLWVIILPTDSKLWISA